MNISRIQRMILMIAVVVSICGGFAFGQNATNVSVTGTNSARLSPHDFWMEVERLHPGAQSTAATKDFQAWLNSLPAKYQTIVDKGDPASSALLLDMYDMEMAKNSKGVKERTRPPAERQETERRWAYPASMQSSPNANVTRAYSFELQLWQQMATLTARAIKVGVVLPEDKPLTTTEKMVRSKYRGGSMSSIDMTSYERKESAKLAELQAPVAAAEKAAYQNWRQDSPVEQVHSVAAVTESTSDMKRRVRSDLKRDQQVYNEVNADKDWKEHYNELQEKHPDLSDGTAIDPRESTTRQQDEEAKWRYVSLQRSIEKQQQENGYGTDPQQ